MENRICQGCGGVLGRDCWNEQDCIQISQSNHNIDAQLIQNLQAFKDYTHARLDGMGIHPNPEGEHSRHGCRIGDRMDVVEAIVSEHNLMRGVLIGISKGNWPDNISPFSWAAETLKQLSDGK